MKVARLRIESRGQWALLVGDVCWEDSNCPPEDIYFGTSVQLAADLSKSGNAFLAGCVLAALKHHEERIFVDAPCCPWLCHGLETVVAYFNHWFYGGERRLRIEVPAHAEPERVERRTALFLSGGVDSTFALWDNTRRLPHGHPGRVRDAIVLQGFEIRTDQPTAEQAYANALAALEPVAQERDVELVPIVTNLRQLVPDGQFWGWQFQGAILAAAAHALAPRFTDVILAASTDIANLRPYGTHPAVDANLSSYSLSIHHQGERHTRIEKLRCIADWQPAIDNLRVCSKAPARRLNCEKCEKCMRVMLELLVVGKLHSCSAFTADDVTPEMLSQLRVDGDAIVFFTHLAAKLRQIGRIDLAKALMRPILADMPRRLQAYGEEIIKDLDHSFSGGRIRSWVRKWRS